MSKRKSGWRAFLNGLGKKYAQLCTMSFVLGSGAYTFRRAHRIPDAYLGSAKEFRDVVVKFWKPYGVRPQRFWYRLFCAGSDHYDPRYIPNTIWQKTIVPYFNNLSLNSAYTDKGMLSRLFPDVKQPETVVKNMGGSFYNGAEEPISREEAVRLCRDEEHVIFKPTIESGGGRDIQFFDKADMPAERVDELFDSFDCNFIAQRIVKQHPDLARINASTLNTMRVLSFRFNGEVHILSAQLRMGSSKARIDNVAAGGCACPIKPDGWLREKAVSHKSKWTDETENGIKLKDIRVPSYDRVTETIKTIHGRMPYFGIIGWDFAVSEDGEPVLIEFNLKPGQNQIGGKEPTFGDMTEAVLEEVYLKKSLEGKYIYSNA